LCKRAKTFSYPALADLAHFAKLSQAGNMPEFGCAFLYRCNHFFFRHGVLLRDVLLGLVSSTGVLNWCSQFVFSIRVVKKSFAKTKKPPAKVAEIQNFVFTEVLWTAGALACVL
jgi:hypothetical protein